MTIELFDSKTKIEFLYFVIISCGGNWQKLFFYQKIIVLLRIKLWTGSRLM